MTVDRSTVSFKGSLRKTFVEAACSEEEHLMAGMCVSDLVHDAVAGRHFASVGETHFLLAGMIEETAFKVQQRRVQHNISSSTSVRRKQTLVQL